VTLQGPRSCFLLFPSKSLPCFVLFPLVVDLGTTPFPASPLPTIRNLEDTLFFLLRKLFPLVFSFLEVTAILSWRSFKLSRLSFPIFPLISPFFLHFSVPFSPCQDYAKGARPFRVRPPLLFPNFSFPILHVLGILHREFPPPAFRPPQPFPGRGV